MALLQHVESSASAAAFSATTAGTLLFAYVTDIGAAITFTMPDGWVACGPAVHSTSLSCQAWYYPNNPGGITTVTTSNTGGFGTIALQEHSGVIIDNPLDQHAEDFSNLFTGVPSVSTSTSATGTVLALGGFLINNGGYTAAAGSGYTGYASTDSLPIPVFDEWQYLAGGGAIAFGLANSTTTEYVVTMATFLTELPQPIATNTRANSAGTTIALTVPAAGVAAGMAVHLFVAVSSTTITGWSAADTQGNKYVLDFIQAQSSSVLAVFSCASLVKALVSTNTITVTTPSVSWAALSGSFKRGNCSVFDLSKQATGSSTAPASGTSAATITRQEIVMGVISANLGPATGDSLTETITLPTAGYTALTKANANGGTSTAARTLAVFPYYHEVAVIGTQAFAATLGHTDTWVAAVVTYKAAPVFDGLFNQQAVKRAAHY